MSKPSQSQPRSVGLATQALQRFLASRPSLAKQGLGGDPGALNPMAWITTPTGHRFPAENLSIPRLLATADPGTVYGPDDFQDTAINRQVAVALAAAQERQRERLAATNPSRKVR